jgi:hypothetical protein
MIPPNRVSQIAESSKTMKAGMRRVLGAIKAKAEAIGVNPPQ